MKVILICTLFCFALSMKSHENSHFRHELHPERIRSMTSDKVVSLSSNLAKFLEGKPQSEAGEQNVPRVQNSPESIIMNMDDADNELLARSPPQDTFYPWKLLKKKSLRLQKINNNLVANQTNSTQA